MNNSMAAARIQAHVPSITPFDVHGNLDENALRLHFQRLAASGITVYVGGSGSGEGNTLTFDETRRLYQIAVDELKGKVPVRGMGVEPRTAAHLIELIGLAEQAGLEAMHIYGLDVGHGIRPTERELERYYTNILSSMLIPAVLSLHYTIGYQLPPSLIKRLAKRFDNIKGVIVSSSDFKYVAEVVSELGQTLEVHAAVPNMLNVFALGGHGVGISEANLVPNLCMSAINSYNNGDLASASGHFHKILQLHAVNINYGSIRGVKAALGIFGLPGGFLREPRLALSAEEQSELGAKLDALGIRSAEGLS